MSSPRITAPVAVAADHALQRLDEILRKGPEREDVVWMEVALAAGLIATALCTVWLCCRCCRGRSSKGYAMGASDDMDGVEDGESGQLHDLVAQKVAQRLEASFAVAEERLACEGGDGSPRKHGRQPEALPWGRVKLPDEEDPLPAKAVRPDRPVTAKQRKAEAARQEAEAAARSEGERERERAAAAAAAAKERAARLPVGSEVIVVRLLELAHLNGRVGVLRRADPEAGRFYVEVSHSGERLALRGENLIPNDFDDDASAITGTSAFTCAPHGAAAAAGDDGGGESDGSLTDHVPRLRSAREEEDDF